METETGRTERIGLMQAIAHREGFYVLGSRAQRNNNPGNINFTKMAAARYSAVLEDIPEARAATIHPRFARYPDAATGWRAMRDLLSAKYAGMSLKRALEEWAPASDDNDTEAYLNFVVERTGLPASTIITDEILTLT